MLSLRLFHLMETHADPIAEVLLQKVLSSPHCSDFRKIPPAILRRRSHEIYHDLTAWLVGTAEEDVARKYTALGEERAEQSVRLSHQIWAILAAKRSLWEFVEREGIWENPVELHGALELLALIDRFFDDAIFYSAAGHERHRAKRAEGVGAH